MDRVGVDQWQKLQLGASCTASPGDNANSRNPRPCWQTRQLAHTHGDECRQSGHERPRLKHRRFEPLPDGYDLSAYGFGDPDAASEAGPSGIETKADAEMRRWPSGCAERPDGQGFELTPSWIRLGTTGLSRQG